LSIPIIADLASLDPMWYYRAMENEYISLRKAREILKVSKLKMSGLVKENKIALFNNPLDKRQKLVKKADIEKLRTPRPR
jgi:hypothetical protein